MVHQDRQDLLCVCVCIHCLLLQPITIMSLLLMLEKRLVLRLAARLKPAVIDVQAEETHPQEEEVRPAVQSGRGGDGGSGERRG